LKQLLKAIDGRFLGHVFRRTKRNARFLQTEPTTDRLGLLWAAFSRERALPEASFLHRTENPRFIGGTTGRSGTRWLVKLLRHQFGSRPVVMDEIGVFVLSLLRAAPYEYYQFGTDNAAARRAAYLEYFLAQFKRYAFRRRNMYGAGMRGLVDYVPMRAIDLAGRALAQDVARLSSFEEIRQRFGEFYLHLLNYHAAIIHGESSGWINKEPPYGRHADDLFAMVPHARLVVLARDGRASAVSMYRRRWMDSIRACMERWGTFAQMTVDALENAPAEGVLLIRYEDLVRDFETKLSEIHRFLSLPHPDFDSIYAAGKAGLAPDPESLDKWRSSVNNADLDWFSEHYGNLMERLGYEDR
jgi:hypothetical protein